MSTGAQHVAEWDDDSVNADSTEGLQHDDVGALSDNAWEEPPPLRPPLLERLFVALLVVVALTWIGAGIWLAWSTHPDGRFDPAEIARGIAFASGPLALLALLFVITQRNSGRAARRFGATATAMRAQARSLDAVMAAIAARIEENREALTAQAEQLMALGEESASRLAAATESLRADTIALARQSKALEGAAAVARNDMAVLVADMPRVEADARAMADTLKDAGLRAHEEAGALSATLTTLAARAQEAEDGAGGAAQRLAAHIARIEGSSEVAEQKIDAVAAKLTGSIEDALASSAEAIDKARQGIDVQNAAVNAMVSQAQAALDNAGTDSAEAIALKIDRMSAQIERLAQQLATYDATGKTILSNFDHGIAGVEARFVAVDDTVASRTASLAESVGNLSSYAERMTLNLNSGNLAADALIQRAGSLRTVLDICFHELGESLPQALTRLEEQASAHREIIAATVPEISRLESGATLTAARLSEAEASVIRQRSEIDALVAMIDERVEAILRKAASLDSVIGDANDSAARFTDAAGPQLIEALLRVRETAAQAAERAREALSEVIPASAAAIGLASGEAVRRAVSEQVTAQIGRIGQVAEDAVATASHASDRLTRQLADIADTSAAVEARIDDAREEVEHANRDTFSKRTAELVESLNSTAIDVAKLLSNEVTDSAWAAYLKGDRGIFTRRAVRLISKGEAREIARHYQEEPEFRSQVNRYIHDFEAMLRPVLGIREGTALGVTLLSSDMGKLYVALAQAIERLRR